MGDRSRVLHMIKVLAGAAGFLMLLAGAVAAADNPKFEVVPVTGHSQPATALAFSPEGRRMLTASWEGSVKLWDVATGRLIRSFVAGGETVYSVAFSPDGMRFVAGYGDRTMKLWDVASGKLLRTFASNAGVASVAFSGDGAKVAAAEFGKSIRIWNAASGQLIRTIAGATGASASIVFSPDGTLLLATSSGDVANLWDIATGRLVRTFTGHARWIPSVAFAPDGRRILSGSQDHTMRMWDAQTGAVLRSFAGHADGIASVAFSPDGGRALSLGHDGQMKLWDAATGELLRSFKAKDGYDKSAAFSPDGIYVAAPNDEDSVTLWEAGTGRFVRNLAGRTIPVTSVAFSPDGRQVLWGGDVAAKLTDAATGEVVRLFGEHAGVVSSIAFSRDGARVLTGSWDETAKLWDRASGRLLQTFAGGSGGVTAGAISPNGARVLTGSSNNQVKLWDAATGRVIRDFVGHRATMRAVAFSPDGTRILSAGSDRTMKLWDAESGKLIRNFTGYSHFVLSVAFSPDGTRLLSGSWASPMKLWDAESGQLIRSFEGHTDYVTSAVFSPDGTQILSGSLDRTVRLWDVATGRSVRTFTGHSAAESGAPSPRGGSGNRYTFPGEVGGIKVAFTSDGNRVVAGSSDTTIKLWNAKSGEPIAMFLNMPGREWLVLTPAGFFASSPNGAGAISVVRGLDIASVQQFYDHLYRPDLVREKLKGDGEGKYLDAASKVSLETIVDSGSAPQIEQPAERRTERIGGTVKITVRVTDTGGGIGQKLIWRVNGVTQGQTAAPAAQAPAISSGYRIVTQTLSIDPSRRNVIEVTAYNAAGLVASEPYRIEIDKYGEAAGGRSRMYVLAVGVSNYARREWRLTYGASDAKLFGTTLKSAASGIYAEPKLIPLVEEQATAKGIEAAINSLQGDIKPSDVFVLYLAGHGRSIAGTYYFLPQDLQLDRGQTVMSNGISQELLQQWLARIPAQNSVLILDTCESAGAARGEIEQHTAIERLQHAIGRSVITAASNAAFEGYQGHGVLTYSILEELTRSGKPGGGVVSLYDVVEHVKQRVPEISLNVWGERQEPHSKIGDNFPLGVRVAALTPAPSEVVPASPTHVLVRREGLRERPANDAPVTREVDRGTQVRVLSIVAGWAQVAREGQKLGYVPEEALLRLQ